MAPCWGNCLRISKSGVKVLPGRGQLGVLARVEGLGHQNQLIRYELCRFRGETFLGRPSLWVPRGGARPGAIF